MAAHSYAWCMGFLQNYLGLQPAYKDGYALPLLGMMKQHCIEIGRR